MPDRKNFLIIALTSVVMWLGMELWFKPTPPASSVATVAAAKQPAPIMLPENHQTLSLGNAALSLTIDPQGGVVRSCDLLGYPASVEPESAPVSLLQTPAQGGSANEPYQYVHATWGEGDHVPHSQTSWSVVSHDSADRRTDGAHSQPQLTLGWTNPQGVEFRQQFALVQPYVLQVTQTVVNPSSATAPVPLHMGMRLVQKKPRTAGQMILHEGVVGMTEGRLQEVTYAKLAKQGSTPTYMLQSRPQDTGGSLGGWLGLTDKYWLMAMLANQGSLLTARASMVSDSWLELAAQGPAVQVKPGQEHTQTVSMYVGPKRLSVLQDVGQVLNIDRLHMAVDFGWFYFLTKPMLTFLTWLKEGLGNFGLAILVMTIGIKGLLFPLSARAFRSMWRMKQLQPKLAALKLKYAQDKMKMNQATIELYKNEGINPLAGLWPMLIQIPIFFSLYKVLFISIEMRHAPFWGWISDLSAADPTSLWNGFGLLPWSAPSWLPIGLWPVLMGLTMVGQQHLSGAVVTDRQQKIMLTYAMPALFAFMLSQFPVGLVIYWTWNNLLTMGQQWFMIRYYGRDS